MDVLIKKVHRLLDNEDPKKNIHNDKIKVGVCGLGFVGNSMFCSFKKKVEELELSNISIIGYDKFKDNGIGKFEDLVDTDILFLALPTVYSDTLKCYEYKPIIETCDLLNNLKYQGIIVLKSTVNPLTTFNLASSYPILKFVHNPEFLTARTAYEDFHNQKHIVLGKAGEFDIDLLIDFYKVLYPEAEISLCSSNDSECMKIFCNTFYSVKIQYFNELYLLCQKINANYDQIVELMIKNGWINPMHTKVPGPDGKLSYGGLCFPKDTNALLHFMKKNDSEHAVLEATINERNILRDDHDNVIV